MRGARDHRDRGRVGRAERGSPAARPLRAACPYHRQRERRGGTLPARPRQERSSKGWKRCSGPQARLLAVTRADGVSLSFPRAGRREYLEVDSPFYGRPVNDVVGAGDAFRAGFAAYLARHQEAGANDARSTIGKRP